MNTPSKSKMGLIVVSSLTGSDRKVVLQQTAELPEVTPEKGSAQYETFLARMKKSPANFVSTIMRGLQEKDKWEIATDNNYQDYVNNFNGAPFVIGMGGGTGSSSGFERSTVEDTISNILTTAGVPDRKINDLIEGLKLDDFLGGDFQDDPKTLSFITQNLAQNDGKLTLTFTTYNCTVQYTPGKPKRFSDKKRPPTYSVEGQIASSDLVLEGKAYFAEKGEQFLGFGLTRVTDWVEAASTPMIKDASIFNEH